MLTAVLSGFFLAIAAPFIHGRIRRYSGIVLAALPSGLFVYFLRQASLIVSEGGRRFAYPWIPTLGINFSFYLDGWSLLFALLICGIGALVIIYASGYLKGHPQLGRFYAVFLLFMASMLGLVLADNVIALFVFWELTSLSSYLLIGFDHEREKARKAALQALLVTGVGGLAMLAGLLLMGMAGGSLELSVLLSEAARIRSNPLYSAVAVLVLIGAFAKSAQFPFHFWLPNAMEAPTPVSTYLHSATMVKAGIYLIARLTPVLGGSVLWNASLTFFGAATFFIGAFLSLKQETLKRFLAYTTVSVLGMLTMLLGLGTEHALAAACTYLVAHAFYKGCLFMVAGAIDHETGENRPSHLSGLRSRMPLLAGISFLAVASMAGLPPFFGFIGKEMLLRSVRGVSAGSAWLVATTFLASAFMIAVALRVGVKPFFGKQAPTPRQAHEAPWTLWLGPGCLAVTGLWFGLFSGWPQTYVLAPAASAVSGHEAHVHLSLWHGWNTSLLISAFAVWAGWILFSRWQGVQRVLSVFNGLIAWGPERGYESLLKGLVSLARIQTSFFQSGYLRYYLAIILVTTVGLGGWTLLEKGMLPAVGAWPRMSFMEASLTVLILVAAWVTVTAHTRLAAVAALGVVGFGVSLIFVLFGAPDLAMTQFVIETLSVILLVLVLYHLPSFERLSKKGTRSKDIVIACAAGVLMGLLVFLATQIQFHPSISKYFSENSYLLAHGRNIVNVILVDFRGFDTLGEITVLAVAGLGVYALLKLRLERKNSP